LQLTGKTSLMLNSSSSLLLEYGRGSISQKQSVAGDWFRVAKRKAE